MGGGGGASSNLEHGGDVNVRPESRLREMETRVNAPTRRPSSMQTHNEKAQQHADTQREGPAACRHTTRRPSSMQTHRCGTVGGTHAGSGSCLSGSSRLVTSEQQGHHSHGREMFSFCIKTNNSSPSSI